MGLWACLQVGCVLCLPRLLFEVVGIPMLWFVGVAALVSIPMLGCNPTQLLLHVV